MSMSEDEFEKRWHRVMERYRNSVDNDESLKLLKEKANDYAKRLGKAQDEIIVRNTVLLSLAVKDEFHKMKQ